MILDDSTGANNNFSKAFNTLSKEDKARVKELIMVVCEVKEGTVYEWIKNPDLVTSKLHRRYIAYLIFNKPIKEFFEG